MQVFKKYKSLLNDLVTRDFKVKYRRSALGFLWSILNPLLMMIVITSVFQTLFRFEIENFPVYYLSGSLIYNFFSEATSSALTSVVNASALIKKVYIPKYIFPLEKVLFSCINMLFSFTSVIIIIIILKAKVYWTIILIPIPMIYITAFCVGIGLILATFQVFFRDVGHLYSVLLTAWFYLTPIIYPVDILPANILGLVKLNPVYYFVDYARQLILYGTLPDLHINLICLAFSSSFLLLGLIIFKHRQDSFILYI